MDEQPDQGMTQGPPLRDDAPTIPIQPIPAQPGRSAAHPEWPIARPGGRPNGPSAQGSGSCFGIALIGMFGAALVLALVAGTLFALHTLGTPAPGDEGAAATAAAQTLTAPTATALPSPTAVPTATATATATATITPTAAPEPAQMSVSPKRTSARCLLGQYPDLTVENSGGADLTWTAATSDAAVQVSPAGGTLAAGATQTVSLSGSHFGKTLTVMFSGNGGDATVTITCK